VIEFPFQPRHTKRFITENKIVLSEEERKDVERRHETSPPLHVRRALPSSATRDLVSAV